MNLTADHAGTVIPVARAWAGAGPPGAGGHRACLISGRCGTAVTTTRGSGPGRGAPASGGTCRSANHRTAKGPSPCSRSSGEGLCGRDDRGNAARLGQEHPGTSAKAGGMRRRPVWSSISRVAVMCQEPSGRFAPAVFPRGASSAWLRATHLTVGGV